MEDKEKSAGNISFKFNLKRAENFARHQQNDSAFQATQGGLPPGSLQQQALLRSSMFPVRQHQGGLSQDTSNDFLKGGFTSSAAAKPAVVAKIPTPLGNQSNLASTSTDISSHVLKKRKLENSDSHSCKEIYLSASLTFNSNVQGQQDCQHIISDVSKIFADDQNLAGEAHRSGSNIAIFRVKARDFRFIGDMITMIEDLHKHPLDRRPNIHVFTSHHSDIHVDNEGVFSFASSSNSLEWERERTKLLHEQRFGEEVINTLLFMLSKFSSICSNVSTELQLLMMNDPAAFMTRLNELTGIENHEETGGFLTRIDILCVGIF